MTYKLYSYHTKDHEKRLVSVPRLLDHDEAEMIQRCKNHQSWQSVRKFWVEDESGSLIFGKRPRRAVQQMAVEEIYNLVYDAQQEMNNDDPTYAATVAADRLSHRIAKKPEAAEENLQSIDTVIEMLARWREKVAGVLQSRAQTGATL